MSESSDSPRGLITAFCLGALAMVAVSLGEANLQRGPSKATAPPSGISRKPSDFSARDWRIAALVSLREFNGDRIPAVAAGVAFFFLLAIFPGISAFVSLYGLVSNVSDVQRVIEGLAGVLPDGAVEVIGAELVRLTQTDHGALGLAFIISLVISIWSANAGMKALIEGLNAAFEAQERRNFFRLTGLSLSLTLGAIAIGVIGFYVAAVTPRPVSPLAAQIGAWLQWPMLLIVSTAALSLLYRLGPCRPEAGWRWITPGSMIATLAWLGMSELFSWYVANFGHYDRTYGSLGAIVGFLTWVWLSLMVVLLGAELNREIEKQAARST
ncbi:MAG TPA: YihY/virulence factor BrkB family protein [Caulobacteraceae bacterium]|nr:YihY/virulence factor BrkB family protein [Caulobacteraceae bacterium]